MNIWCLISFHEGDSKKEITQQFINENRIAIGWGNVGSLQAFRSQSEIGDAIRRNYPNFQNANIGGPTLWHMVANVLIGDLVIVDAQKSWAQVVEITGKYEWDDTQPIFADSPHYFHQRSIKLRNDINADQLINIIGTRPAPGQTAQLVLFYYGSFVQQLQPNG